MRGRAGRVKHSYAHVLDQSIRGLTTQVDWQTSAFHESKGKEHWQVIVVGDRLFHSQMFAYPEGLRASTTTKYACLYSPSRLSTKPEGVGRPIPRMCTQHAWSSQPAGPIWWVRNPPSGLGSLKRRVEQVQSLIQQSLGRKPFARAFPMTPVYPCRACWLRKMHPFTQDVRPNSFKSPELVSGKALADLHNFTFML